MQTGGFLDFLRWTTLTFIWLRTNFFFFRSIANAIDSYNDFIRIQVIKEYNEFLRKEANDGEDD